MDASLATFRQGYAQFHPKLGPKIESPSFFSLTMALGEILLGNTFMPTLRNGLLLVAMATALCACSTNEPNTAKEEELTMQKVLRDANVRDATVLWTEASLGGAAQVQEEWADYLYDAHHTGVALAKPDKSAGTTDAKKDAKDGASGVSDNAKDGIQAQKKPDAKALQDRSIYSRDCSIYAKHQTKTRALKKKEAAILKKAIKGNAQSKDKIRSKSKVQSKKAPLKKVIYQAVKTNTVDGKKVSETIVELKDPPKPNK